MFNELLNELFANGAPSPNVIAWWLTPSDKLVDAHGEVDHYKVVVAQPQTFGISPRDPLLKNPEVNENKLVKLKPLTSSTAVQLIKQHSTGFG